MLFGCALDGVGVRERRAGAFVDADGGTVFLYELTRIPFPSQIDLVRVMDTRRVKAIGSDDERTVDVRVLASVSGDVGDAVDERRIRADLRYAFTWVVHLPETHVDWPASLIAQFCELFYPGWTTEPDATAGLMSVLNLDPRSVSDHAVLAALLRRAGIPEW